MSGVDRSEPIGRPSRRAAGAEAEDAAAEFLRGEGYQIIGRNIRSRFGEIDIVARDGINVVIVEVRSRSSGRFGLAEESIDARKRKRLASLALWFAATRGLEGCALRIDIVVINRDGAGPLQPRLIRNAFDV